MSLPVVLTPEAQAEFDSAVDWYEQHAGNGATFIGRVREALKPLATLPRMHQVVYHDVRRALVRKFPYSILYRVKPDRVEIIAVFHSSRNPSEWQRRV